jgi:hypothetical protein
MNKKSKKRASFVYVILCLFYVAVMFRLPEKLSMTRTSDAHVVPSNSSILPLPHTNEVEQRLPPEGAPSSTPIPLTVAGTAEGTKTPEVVEAPAPENMARPAYGNSSGIEPSLLISIPVICYALKEGWLDRDSLIFAKKDAYNNVSWRKPLEILKDHDEEGIRNILNTIGQKRVLEFMKREAICPGEGVSAEDLLIGRGYTVEQEKLVALYGKYVGKTCDEIFPFSLSQVGMAKGSHGEFRLITGKAVPKEGNKMAEREWMMPNLTGMTMSAAIDKLSPETSNIRVHGYGVVVSQSPRPFERLRGESACVVQGRGMAE